jgi:DNA polymerase III sliding clamp (beta) subunit (PCNA family)
MAARRLATISPTTYNAELVIKTLNGKLSLSSFGQGAIGLEILSEQVEIEGEPIVISLDKLISYLQVHYENQVTVLVKDKSIKVSTSASSGTFSRSIVRLDASIPSDDDLIGEVAHNAFDDLLRVGGISADKDDPRPLLGGVYFMIDNGDLRTIAANGISMGYAWEFNNSIKSSRANHLIQATALQVAQRYDWQGEKIKIYRPSEEKKSMVCFGNSTSYLYLAEMADGQRYPAKQMIEALADSASPYEFYVDSGAFKSYIETAVKLSEYDERSVTVVLANDQVMIQSGKRLKSEVEEDGQEFIGFFEIMPTLEPAGKDFVFCLDAKMARQLMSLLAQVDKGRLRVALGQKTNFIFFSTPLANAIYAIAQIVRG